MTAPRRTGKRRVVSIPITLAKFLLGETHLNGKWFGDTEMRGKYVARYWWRTHLRACLPLPAKGQGKGGRS